MYTDSTSRIEFVSMGLDMHYHVYNEPGCATIDPRVFFSSRLASEGHLCQIWRDALKTMLVVHYKSCQGFR